ncbi:hypothetical protein K7432_011136, partial [Basidiobolus ranarum]
DYDQNPIFGGPNPLPRGSVPPGARFDPIGPFGGQPGQGRFQGGNRGRGRGGFSGEPDHDHLPPPGSGSGFGPGSGGFGGGPGGMFM